MELEGHPFEQPVTALAGVGTERQQQLARLKIARLGDLLLHGPRRYEDRRRLISIARLQPGVHATVRGHIEAAGLSRRGRGRSVFEIALSDGTGRLRCRWWNLPYMQNYIRRGDELFVYGKASKERVMDHPETELVEGDDELLHLNRVVPVYPLTEGLSQRWLRGLIWRTLAEYADQVPEPPWTAGDSMSRRDALRALHFPESLEAAELARRRLGLDELVEMQVRLLRRRRAFELQHRGLPCGGTNLLVRPFLRALGFQLTEAQKSVLRELRSDLAGPHPMRRLLQGDVGSGKTVVGACAALMTLECGFNVALMAPTEVLAEQLFSLFSRWFEPLGLQVLLRTGGTQTFRGSAQANTLVIGTHALANAGFDWPRIGLVIIDEQHKFGVAQREQLVKKGEYPHLLVMTATPIPRTLGLTVYGDLDVSTIREGPAARGKVKTFVRSSKALPKVWQFTRQKLAKGQQAYVVYPRIEESSSSNRKALMKELETVRQSLAPYRVEMLHGGMRSKEEIMREFRSGAVQVLVATAVIEVGVDVPNASVIVIENAELFGLAQLHQLRGRVGRGRHPSVCILVSDARTQLARERLRVLERTTNGFEVAEADLALRGPGELLGQAQSGLPGLRFAELDLELVQRARALAEQAAEINAWH